MRRKILAGLLACILLLGLAGCGADGGRRTVRKVDWVTSPAYETEDVPLPTPAGDLVGCCTDGEYMYILVDEKVEDQVRPVLSRVSLEDGETAVLEDYEPSQTPEGAFLNRYGPVLAPDGTLWVYETWTISYYDLPEDFDEERETKGKYLTGQDSFHHLRQLDAATGREKRLVDLSEAVVALNGDDVFDFSSFAVDSRENVYFSKTGGVAVLNRRGNLQFTLEADLPRNRIYNAAGGNLVLLPDGSVAALTVKAGGAREVRGIDPDAKDWGGLRCELPSTEFLYGGSGGSLFFYTSGNVLYGWPEDGEEAQPLLSWSAAGLSGSTMCLAPLENGRFAALGLHYDPDAEPGDWYSTGIRLSLCSPTDKLPEDGKATLVYGTRYVDDAMRARINRFNQRSEDYQIEIRDYGSMGSENMRMQLSADVMSGRGPDIWDGSLPLDLYARKGYLEDLWPWIDSDEELGGRDALMSHMLDCASIDGKLYKVGASFSIDTLVGCTSVVGSRTGWTMDELLETWDSLPAGSLLLDASDNQDIQGLVIFLEQNQNRWVDWSTGECLFDSEDFKAVLELCASLGSAQPEPTRELSGYPVYEKDAGGGEALRAGRQLLAKATLSDTGDILYYEALCGGPEVMTDYQQMLNENNIYANWIDEEGNWRDKSAALTCQELYGEIQAKESGMLFGWYPLADDVRFGALEGGGYASYVGYPTPEGSGSAFRFGYDNCAAISASSAHKDGAWAFVRQYLLPGGSGPVRVGSTSYLSSGFPINKADFEAALRPEDAWFRFESGEYALDQDGDRIRKPLDRLIPIGYPVKMAVYPLAPSEEQAERFMELYNATGRMAVTEYSVIDIVVEQAQPYFAGDKSLEETASLIQNRVSLYVNENR